jgi:AraC-like DNA-binding protein
MEKAVELLADGSVETVARQLGFADTGYFIRTFRRWVGMTPGEMKRTPSAWIGSKIVLS